MLSRLPGRQSPATGPSRTPPDCVIWAVGDIHGRSDLADRLFQAIRADLAGTDASRRVVVFLGDHVDRGLDSKGVLNQLCNFAADPSLEVHFIRGNHEQQMETFLDDPAVGPGWCDCGGRDTLMSYGVVPPTNRDDIDGWSAASRALNAAMPTSHHEVLWSQGSSVCIGDYFFCHAGARPGVALEAQSSEDLMSIREAFLTDPAPFEKVVVHGHTPTEAVVSDARRIGIDTGAWTTNVLSAVRLAGETRVLIQATGRAGRVTISTAPLLS